jgi:hypothetical protein
MHALQGGKHEGIGIIAKDIAEKGNKAGFGFVRGLGTLDKRHILMRIGAELYNPCANSPEIF